MKTILTFLSAFIFLLMANKAFAQTQGAITFETKFNTHRNIPEDQAAMKDMMPEFRTTRQILTFTPTESLFKPLVDEQDDMTAATSGGHTMVIRTPMTQTYINTAKEQVVTQRDFMGKTYLTEDSLSILPWKFSNETKTILNYPCKKATYTDDRTDKTTVAWFTDKLRPGLGPENYTSLPGTVLEVDFDNGLSVIKATKIDFKPLKKNDLVVPAKGEKITKKQYQEMVAERMKNRRGGTGGNVIIRN